MSHPPKPKPFLFTRWLYSPDLLRPWLAHFSHHNVPAGIVSRRRSPPFALWRVGVEATGENTLKQEEVSSDMRVEESINGFAEAFNKYKEEVERGGPRRTTDRQEKEARA